MEYKECYICGNMASEVHHVIFRSKNPALIKSPINLKNLCHNCHYKIHFSNSSEGRELDLKLKLKLQNELELQFDKSYLTFQEIKEVLKITDKLLTKMLKTLKTKEGKYEREEVIRKIMGGVLYC